MASGSRGGGSQLRGADAGRGPHETADALIVLGGPLASSPSALLARVLSLVCDPAALDPLAAAGMLDPARLFDAFTAAPLVGLRPLVDPALEVVAHPRQRMPRVRAGDLLLRRALGEPGAGHVAFVASDGAYPLEEARARGLWPESERPGYYAHVVEAGSRPHSLAHGFARRVAGAEGGLPSNTLILRPRVGLRGRARFGLAEDIDLNRATEANAQYAVQLGWNARVADIDTLLGLRPNPSDEDFAQSVATWQSQHALTSDGMLGPNTWAAMQPLLPAPTKTIDVDRAVQANRQYSAQLGWGVRIGDIDGLIGVGASASEQDFAQAVAGWQTRNALQVDGIIGPDTWAAMQLLLSAPPGPGPGPGPSPGPSPPAPPTPPAPPDDNADFAPVVVVKIADSIALNLDQGQTLSVSDLIARASAISSLAAPAAGALPPDITFKRACDSLSAAAVDALVARAKAQDPSYDAPNFNNVLELILDPQADAESIASALEQWVAVVDYAYVAGVPSDANVIGTSNPLFVSQGYLAAAPLGISVQDAWAKGADGSGRAFIDIEKGWFLNHQDLPVGVPLLAGTNSQKSFSHGSAVLSEIIARDDSTGMVGAAPNARASVISYFRPGLSLTKNPVAEIYDSILLAIASLFFGDVLLLEVQFEDKVGRGSSTNVPVETDPHVFEAIKLATKCGVIVVEAAGNGMANLDLFVGYKGPDKGKTVFLKGAQNQFKDSGAIMVGASTSTFPLQRWPGSNFGSRVDCYSWGENIVACGFNPKQANVFWGVPGQIVNYGDKDLSNASFGGTSGASPVIVGCCLLVQNLQTLMTPRSGVKGSLGPERMRQMLANDMNGTRSFLTTDQIGMMPDLRKIIANEFV